MLSSASPIHLSALNFAVQASLLGFSSLIIPEGTGEVELFSTDAIVENSMDETDDQYDGRNSTSLSRRKWRDDVDNDNPLQNIVFVTGRNTNRQCLIDSSDYEKQIKLFVQRMQKRVNFAELVDLKPNGELTDIEKNLGLDLSDDTLMSYLIGVKIPNRVEGQKFRIKQIVNLENGTMVLNECDSQVYIIGDVGDGIQCVDTLSKISLYDNDILVEEKIESIYNGADFAFFITESNQLYAYGQNLQKQLSIPDCTHTDPMKAQRVSSSLFCNERPLKVACGAQHTILVTEQGNIYYSGRLHNFESSQFIICRISSLTTETIRNYLLSQSIGRGIDLIFNGYIVKKSKCYWLWQIMNSVEIYQVIKQWIQSFEIEPIGLHIFEATNETPEEIIAKLDQNAMSRLESLVKMVENNEELEESITVDDIIQLLTTIFEEGYLHKGLDSSVETLFLRDFAYLIFTEIITNCCFTNQILKLLSLKDLKISPKLTTMTSFDFALEINRMRKDLIIFENQNCFTQKGYQGVHQLINTFYESFIVSKCNKLYHFPAKGYAPHLLTFSLLDPFVQIGPKGCENYRNRNDVSVEKKRYAVTPNGDNYNDYETSWLKSFIVILTESGSVLLGDKYDYWEENTEVLTVLERFELSKIQNPLPYQIRIEKSDTEFKLYFDTTQNRQHGNIVNISKLPEGAIISLDDYTCYILGSNAYSELGYPSFYNFTTHFKIHETLNKLRPSTIFSEQYSMVLECSKDATNNLDSRFITGIQNSNYLNKILAPFQYQTNSSSIENRTFFFSGDSSGIRSISAVPEDNDQDDSDNPIKSIKESEKMVQFNHLSLLKVRYAPDLARYGFDLNLSIGLDTMIVFFTKKTEHNNSWIFMIRKLEKLVDTPRFSDCQFMFDKD